MPKKTYTDETPRLDVGVLGVQGLDESRKLLGDTRRRVLAEEGTQVLLLLVGVGRVPLNGARLALEPVGHEYLVLGVVVAGGQNVGALDGLVEVAEDVVDDHNTLGGIIGAGDIGLQAIVLAVGTLGVVAGGDNGRDVAADGFVLVTRGVDDGRRITYQASLWPWQACMVDILAVCTGAGLLMKVFASI